MQGAAGSSSSGSSSGTGIVEAQGQTPVAGGTSGSRAEEGRAQPSGEDRENDSAAVTAVIWKELAELSAAQAKLKVGQQSFFCCQLL